MQPTEPTPSTDVQQSGAEVRAAEDSSQSEEPVSEAPSWWRRLIGGRREPEPTEADAQAASQPPTRTMTEEEFHRAIQSETDRREAKRQREAAEAEKRRLRDDDPWQYAEQERVQEQAQQAEGQLNDLLAGIGQAHDRVTLQPLMDALPKDEQARLMALPGAGVGADGRKLLTDEALKVLEKHWRAEGARDAETKLRRNPAFRKQVMSELQGGYPEPELLPSGSARNHGRSSEDINDMLRAQIGIHRET